MALHFQIPQAVKSMERLGLGRGRGRHLSPGNSGTSGSGGFRKPVSMKTSWERDNSW